MAEIPLISPDGGPVPELHATSCARRRHGDPNPIGGCEGNPVPVAFAVADGDFYGVGPVGEMSQFGAGTPLELIGDD